MLFEKPLPKEWVAPVKSQDFISKKTIVRGRAKRFFQGCVSILLIICIAGFVYEHVSRRFAPRLCPPQGRLVDIGGYRLHLYCIGDGLPTVVFDSGAFDSLRQWDRVQPQVATITRACSFDRAGLGWSDQSLEIPSFRHSAEDLRKLLSKARVPGPYVLVGHSNGGLDTQDFAHLYADSVVGMVLDDSVNAEETLRFPERFKTPGWLRLLLKLAMPIGIPRLMGWCDETAACPDCAKFTDTVLTELKSYNQSEAEVRSGSNFDDLPLFVLEHDPAIGLAGERDEAFERAWVSWQKRLAALSSNSRLQIVHGVGHEIQRDRPETVVEAVKWVINQSRKEQGRRGSLGFKEHHEQFIRR